MTNQSEMTQLADYLADALLASGKQTFRVAWRIKKQGQLTNKYVAVVVFEVDEDIFDDRYPGRKATALPARQGSVQVSQVCPCCNGSGIRAK